MDYKNVWEELEKSANSVKKMSKSERIQLFRGVLFNEVKSYEVMEFVSGRSSVRLCEELDKMGYFDVPASLNFHGAFDGGLFAHSLRVAKILADHTKKLGSKWERYCSPWIVGLFHDLCKCDEYVHPRCDIYADSERIFASDPSMWEHNEQKLIEGHGEKSVMLLSQFMVLTEEEILCIRYHMGAYNTDDWNSFDLAIKKYPNVLYTHTADMLASKVYDI